VPAKSHNRGWHAGKSFRCPYAPTVKRFEAVSAKGPGFASRARCEHMNSTAVWIGVGGIIIAILCILYAVYCWELTIVG
jgi:hypothetical protein